MKYCYAHYAKNRPECQKCRLVRWCKTAPDGELMRDAMPSFDEAIESNAEEQLSQEYAAQRENKARGERLQYSRNDLLEVIVYMLSLDPMALELLNEKIADPDISLSEIARRRHTSRQAVQQALRRKCKNNPELARLLNNRENKHRQRKQTTFMEAVCQIRRQQSAMSWNAHEPGSKFYRSLKCWNRNFDLSKMSILKGSAFLGKD